MKPFPSISRFLLSLLLALGATATAGGFLVPARAGSVNSQSNFPPRLLAAVARSEAAAAAHSSRYRLDEHGCARLPATALGACFGAHGARISGAARPLVLTLTGWGRAGAVQPVRLVREAPRGNRIAYRGAGLRESWRALPLGFEQRFVLAKPPAGLTQARGRVILELRASQAPRQIGGSLAWGRLRYGGLAVRDAAGRAVPAVLSAHGRVIELSIRAAHARWPLTVDPLVWVQQEVTASDGAASDWFGFSVALSANGATALVGADNGDGGQGAAYVYTLSNGTWSQTAELTAANGAANDSFGFSVALSANGATALVGAWNKTVGGNSDQGAAYVYTEPSGGWATTSTYSAELIASNGAASDHFGFSVALSGNGATALVGAWNKTVGGNSDQGAAYVYTLTAGTWSQAAELTAANGAASDYFGYSVALSANGATALVGANNKTVGTNSYQGAAYVYTLTAGTWSQAAELTAADGAASDSFGFSVALAANGATALVGAPGGIGANSYPGPGAAYVYTLTVGTWSQVAELIASNGAASDHFGWSVALSANGATALVGAWNKTVGGNSAQGAAYFFGGSDLSAVLNAPATVQAGTQFPGQYILTNAGTTASVALVVSLPLPTNAGYVSASASQGSCSYNSTAKLATCALGSILGNGGTASATLNLKATGAAGSIIAQSAQLVNASPNLAQTANTAITPPPPSGGSSGGGGSLGLLGLLALLGLAVPVTLRRRRTRA